MSDARVRRLTDLLRNGEDPRWQALREHLAVEEIDPNRAVLADIFSDGEELDTGVLVGVDRRVFEFSLEYFPPPTADEQPAEPEGDASTTDPDPIMASVLRGLARRHEVDADVVNWFELYEEEGTLSHSKQIDAAMRLLDEEGSPDRPV